MRALFISFNQAFYEEVINILEKLHLKGYTSWETVQGRGTHSGEPHLGNHVWPTLNSAILTFVDDNMGEIIMQRIDELDASSPKHGIRAFWWEIGGTTK